MLGKGSGREGIKQGGTRTLALGRLAALSSWERRINEPGGGRVATREILIEKKTPRVPILRTEKGEVRSSGGNGEG